MNMMCCSLCTSDFDSHPHLFFECKYSYQVWLIVKDDAFMHNVSASWDDIVIWLSSRAKSRSITSVIGKLMVAATAYFIWQERNNRLFANHARPPDILANVIKTTVRARLLKLKFKRNARVQSILSAWKIHGDTLFQDGY